MCLQSVHADLVVDFWWQSRVHTKLYSYIMGLGLGYVDGLSIVMASKPITKMADFFWVFIDP